MRKKLRQQKINKLSREFLRFTAMAALFLALVLIGYALRPESVGHCLGWLCVVRNVISPMAWEVLYFVLVVVPWALLVRAFGDSLKIMRGH